MNFPVDLLADVSQAELEQLAHNYMNDLLYSNPDSPEHLTLSDSTQVTINISSVGFVPLHGLSDKQKILALFSPRDSMTTVALYLLDRWWTVDDILKTADPARDGPMEVETVGERIVLYILNRVIYRAKEMSTDELPFLCHGENDHAKILWNKGEAVGFYSVKPSGSLCNRFSTRSYLLPVMDSIFVRKCQRGKGFGLRMLEDFVLSFKEDKLGLRYPLTKAMYKVCKKYLLQYPGDTDLLWEVESIGAPNQRTNIANKIQGMDLSAVSRSLSFTEDSLVMTEVTEEDVVMEAITTQIKEAESMKCTVEIVEEVTILRGTKVSEADLAVTARARSGGSKRRHVGEKIMEDKSEKMIRIEDIEAETPRGEHVSAQQKTGLHDVSDLVQAEVMFSVEPEENGEDVVDTAPKEAAAMMSDTPATVLASQDLEEADVRPTTVEPQVEDDATRDPNNTSHDSNITVENVASEIEEAEEDTAVLVSEEVLKEQKEAEGTQAEVTNEQAEEKVTQHVVDLSTHATSEGWEVGKTVRNVVKAIKVQSETPRRRSQRHTKLEVETTSQDVGRVLRQRTVTSIPTPKRRYTRHSRKVNEELENEVNAFAENDSSATEVVQELAVTEGDESEGITSMKGDGVAVEELREEEGTEKQEEPEVEDTELKESSKESQDRTEASEEKTHVKAVDEQMGKQGETVDRTEEEISTEELTVEAAEDVNSLTEVNDEDTSEVQEDEDRRTETLSFEADKEEEANNMIHEPETVSAASETLIPDEVEEAAAPEAEEENNTKLQTDTLLSLDLKTTCHQSVREAEETGDEEQTPEPEMVLEEQDEGKQETSPEMNVNATVEEDSSDKEKEAADNEKAPFIETRVLRSGRKSAQVSYRQQEEDNKGEIITEEEVDHTEPITAEEEEGDKKDLDKDAFTLTDPMEESQSADTEADMQAVEDAEDNLPPAEVDEAMRSEEEEEPAVTTRTLKRGRKSASAIPKSKSRRTRKQIQEEEQKEPEGSTSVEETGVEEGEAGLGSAEEPQIEEEEQQVKEEDTIEQEKEELVPLSEEGTLQVLTASEEEATPSAQEQHSQETAPQLSDLQRLTVVLVDVNKSRHDVQEETAAEEEVPVEKTADEAEVEQQEEATKQEETVEDEHLPGSPDGIENTEGEKVVEEEEGSGEKVNDAITIKEAEEERAEEAAQEEEDKSVDDDEEEEEEEPVTETRTLRRRKKVAKTPPKRRSTRNRQKRDEEEKQETSDVKQDEPTVEVRVLRRGRKSVPITPRSTRKRTRKQLQEEEEKEEEEEEEGEEEPLAVEEGGAEEEEEQAEKQTFDQDKGLEEKDSAEQVENIETGTGGEEVGTVAQEAVTLSEEGQADSTEAVAHEDAEAPVGLNDAEGKTSEEVEEEAVTTQETEEEEHYEAGRKCTERHEEEATGEKSSEEDESAVETRVLRKGRTSAPVQPRRTSKRARTQCRPEDEGEEETTPAKKVQVEETTAVQEEAEEIEQNKNELTEEKNQEEAAAQKEQNSEPEDNHVETNLEDEPAAETRVLRKGRRSAPAIPRRKSKRARTQRQPEDEGEEEPAPAEETFGEEEEAGPESEETGENAAEMEVKEDEDVEEEEGENLAGVESAEDAEKLNDDSTEETAMLEKEDNSLEAVDESGSDLVRAEEVNSAVEEDITLTQGSLTAVAEGEPLDEDESEVIEEKTPAVTTGTLNSSPSQASRRQKGQGVVETQQQVEEDPEDEETQEVHPLTDDLPEIGELHSKEQTETAESSLAGQKAAPPAESGAEEQAKEEMDSPEKEPSEDVTVNSSEGRSLRERVKSVAAQEKMETLPKRRSSRKRSRVNYQETDEEDEGSGTETATNKEEEDEVESDVDQDNKKAESSADEPELEENSREDDLENNLGAVEATSEKGDAINLALDTDDEVEMAGSSQESEEDEQNMLEEEDEPVVIGKRVLRGRSIPSVIITPHSKSRHRRAKDHKSEESDEDSVQSAQKRSLRKRKSTEVTPARKSKRLSRV